MTPSFSEKNKACLETFYEGFQKRDFKQMAQCYHTEAVFEDPAFGKLSYKDVTAMWEMLLKRAENFSLTYSDLTTDEKSGSAQVVACYTFTKTRRKVVNSISSAFEFKNGKIIAQKDTFDLWKWSRQALGTPAYLIGWLPLFQNKIREEARANLAKFQKSNL